MLLTQFVAFKTMTPNLMGRDLRALLADGKFLSTGDARSWTQFIGFAAEIHLSLVSTLFSGDEVCCPCDLDCFSSLLRTSHLLSEVKKPLIGGEMSSKEPDKVAWLTMTRIIENLLKHRSSSSVFPRFFPAL